MDNLERYDDIEVVDRTGRTVRARFNVWGRNEWTVSVIPDRRDIPLGEEPVCQEYKRCNLVAGHESSHALASVEWQSLATFVSDREDRF